MIDYDARSWIRTTFAVRGTVLPRLFVRVVAVAALGVVAVAVQQRSHAKLPTLPHTLIGAALGLLLVFRTNASYDRWWEGRKLLGALVNRTRDVARQIATFTRDEEATRAVQRRLVAFYVLGMQGVRREKRVEVVRTLLRPDELAALEKADAIALWAHLFLSREVEGLRRGGKLTAEQHQLVDANVTALVDYLGGCERIARTPVPFAYAQHIKLFVAIFCGTAPFVMADALGWLTAPVSAVLAFALLGIDEIGVEIEEPFGHDANDLPVDAIGDRIAANTDEIVNAART